MGLLDDAIREHLDLQRRRGADPAEIERAERDALGPVRRGPDELEPVGENLAEAAHDAPGEYEPEPLGEYEAEAEPGVPVEDEHEQYHAPELESFEPVPEPHSSERFEATPPPVPAEAPLAEPELGPLEDHHEDEHASPLEPASEGAETIEYDLEQELEPHGEDVLEETPEFLQDTPDHDRLWFEQRPPRDFDLGGS